MKNFKSVDCGEVTFACSKKYIPEGTKSDILGIYGQNGSGKTAVIEALSILRSAMLGQEIPDVYTDCISANAKESHLEFTFDFQDQRPSTGRKKVVYSFDISRMEKEKEEKTGSYRQRRSNRPYQIRISNEKISASGDFYGKNKKLQTIITTAVEKGTLGPASLLQYYIGKEEIADTLYDLEVNKRYALTHSESFIFKDETLTAFAKSAPEDSEYLHILQDLRHYSHFFLYVIDTKTSGLIRLNTVLPFCTRAGSLVIDLNNTTNLPEVIYNDICQDFDAINIALSELIPDLKVMVKKVGETDDEDGKTLFSVKPYAKRGETEFPLSYESDGVIRIISFLCLYLGAFNDKSCTVAIDEMDAGIYEYLLGEMLSAFEEYGKGQLIFTSHNLRPLELISKESIVFTTSNPQNRYIRLKGVGHSNNLRDVYLREILLNEQDEVIYKAGKRHRMISAIKRAGKGFPDRFKEESDV
ncbi:MAG: ATP-binding protein [Oscillospiraceae bacterium]|nr:ATP-binding protein [Oscillospiraceae bacterium]